MSMVLGWMGRKKCSGRTSGMKMMSWTVAVNLKWNDDGEYEWVYICVRKYDM